jgi:transcriptional regulator with GAF, ATPase, and Fis domain
MNENPLSNLREKYHLKIKRKYVTGQFFEGPIPQLYQEYTKYRALYELAKLVTLESDVESFINALLDKLIDFSGAERSLILIYNSKAEIVHQIGRNLKHEDIHHPSFEVSWSIINQCRNSKDVIFQKNALGDSQFKRAKSVLRLNILSVICVPIIFQENVIGILYIDNRTVRGLFNDQICDLVNQSVNLISSYLFSILQRIELEQSMAEMEMELSAGRNGQPIIGNSPEIKKVLQFIEQAANTTATVLVEGESGTGKELVALALHHKSDRKDRNFISLNCGALQENLLESELFGHVKGAFTSAHADKKGWFETADGGTIFFDEISEMGQPMQVKLLRILQTGEFSPVGSTLIKKCDVRIIAATNISLQELINNGKFRPDLYYRLNILNINVPPLRDRGQDILLLANYFLKLYATKLGRDRLTLGPQIGRLLQQYEFPGNVRELENIMQRVTVLAQGTEVEATNLPDNLLHDNTSQQHIGAFAEEKRVVVEKFEKEYLQTLLQKTNGVISKAARLADMDNKNFHQKMTKYGLKAQNYK